METHGIRKVIKDEINFLFKSSLKLSNIILLIIDKRSNSFIIH